MKLDKKVRYNLKNLSLDQVKYLFEKNNIFLNPIYYDTETIYGIECINDKWYWINFNEEELDVYLLPEKNVKIKSKSKPKSFTQELSENEIFDSYLDVEENEWYFVTYSGRTALIFNQKQSNDRYYGWNLVEDWTDSFNFSSDGCKYQKADLKIVEQHFIKEAEERGVLDVSKAFEFDGNIYRDGYYSYEEGCSKNIYIRNGSCIFSVCGVPIFKNGEWAKKL